MFGRGKRDRGADRPAETPPGGAPGGPTGPWSGFRVVNVLAASVLVLVVAGTVVGVGLGGGGSDDDAGGGGGNGDVMATQPPDEDPEDRPPQDDAPDREGLLVGELNGSAGAMSAEARQESEDIFLELEGPDGSCDGELEPVRSRGGRYTFAYRDETGRCDGYTAVFTRVRDRSVHLAVHTARGRSEGELRAL
jgi:hypothetical protein